MVKVNPPDPAQAQAYPRALFPLFGHNNQLFIIRYPSHVAIEVLHDSQLLSMTSSENFPWVEPGYGSSIRIGPTYFPLPAATHTAVTQWLTEHGAYGLSANGALNRQKKQRTQFKAGGNADGDVH